MGRSPLLRSRYQARLQQTKERLQQENLQEEEEEEEGESSEPEEETSPNGPQHDTSPTGPWMPKASDPYTYSRATLRAASRKKDRQSKIRVQAESSVKDQAGQSEAVPAPSRHSPAKCNLETSKRLPLSPTTSKPQSPCAAERETDVEIPAYLHEEHGDGDEFYSYDNQYDHIDDEYEPYYDDYDDDDDDVYNEDDGNDDDDYDDPVRRARRRVVHEKNQYASQYTRASSVLPNDAPRRSASEAVTAAATAAAANSRFSRARRVLSARTASSDPSSPPVSVAKSQQPKPVIERVNTAELPVSLPAQSPREEIQATDEAEAPRSEVKLKQLSQKQTMPRAALSVPHQQSISSLSSLSAVSAVAPTPSRLSRALRRVPAVAASLQVRMASPHSFENYQESQKGKQAASPELREPDRQGHPSSEEEEEEVEEEGRDPMEDEEGHDNFYEEDQEHATHGRVPLNATTGIDEPSGHRVEHDDDAIAQTTLSSEPLPRVASSSRATFLTYTASDGQISREERTDYLRKTTEFPQDEKVEQQGTSVPVSPTGSSRLIFSQKKEAMIRKLKLTKIGSQVANKFVKEKPAKYVRETECTEVESAANRVDTRCGHRSRSRPKSLQLSDEAAGQVAAKCNRQRRRSSRSCARTSSPSDFFGKEADAIRYDSRCRNSSPSGARESTLSDETRHRSKSRSHHRSSGRHKNEKSTANHKTKSSTKRSSPSPSRPHRHSSSRGGTSKHSSKILCKRDTLVKVESSSSSVDIDEKRDKTQLNGERQDLHKRERRSRKSSRSKSPSRQEETKESQNPKKPQTASHKKSTRKKGLKTKEAVVMSAAAPYVDPPYDADETQQDEENSLMESDQPRFKSLNKSTRSRNKKKKETSVESAVTSPLYWEARQEECNRSPETGKPSGGKVKKSVEPQTPDKKKKGKKEDGKNGLSTSKKGPELLVSAPKDRHGRGAESSTDSRSLSQSESSWTISSTSSHREKKTVDQASLSALELGRGAKTDYGLDDTKSESCQKVERPVSKGDEGMNPTTQDGSSKREKIRQDEKSTKRESTGAKSNPQHCIAAKIEPAASTNQDELIILVEEELGSERPSLEVTLLASQQEYDYYKLEMRRGTLHSQKKAVLSHASMMCSPRCSYPSRVFDSSTTHSVMRSDQQTSTPKTARGKEFSMNASSTIAHRRPGPAPSWLTNAGSLLDNSSNKRSSSMRNFHVTTITENGGHSSCDNSDEYDEDDYECEREESQSPIYHISAMTHDDDDYGKSEDDSKGHSGDNEILKFDNCHSRDFTDDDAKHFGGDEDYPDEDIYHDEVDNSDEEYFGTDGTLSPIYQRTPRSACQQHLLAAVRPTPHYAWDFETEKKSAQLGYSDKSVESNPGSVDSTQSCEFTLEQTDSSKESVLFPQPEVSQLPPEATGASPAIGEGNFESDAEDACIQVKQVHSYSNEVDIKGTDDLPARLTGSSRKSRRRHRRPSPGPSSVSPSKNRTSHRRKSKNKHSKLFQSVALAPEKDVSAPFFLEEDVDDDDIDGTADFDVDAMNQALASLPIDERLGVAVRTKSKRNKTKQR